MQVAQVLLPGLLVIASSQEYGPGVRRKALSIAHSLASALSSKQSPTDRDTRQTLGTLLEAWLSPICAILREPISGQVRCTQAFSALATILSARDHPASLTPTLQLAGPHSGRSAQGVAASTLSELEWFLIRHGTLNLRIVKFISVTPADARVTHRYVLMRRHAISSPSTMDARLLGRDLTYDADEAQDAGGWGVKLEALKLVVALVLNWRKATQQHLPNILDAAWALFTGCLPLYIRGIVKGEEEISDGEVSALVASCDTPVLVGVLSTDDAASTCCMLHVVWLPNWRMSGMTALLIASVAFHLTTVARLIRVPDVTGLHGIHLMSCLCHEVAMPCQGSGSLSPTAAPAVQVDEDADNLSFPAMISQLFEFVLCIVSNSLLLPLLQPVLPELAYLTIGALPPALTALPTSSPAKPHAQYPALYPAASPQLSSAATAGLAVPGTCWRCTEATTSHHAPLWEVRMAGSLALTRPLCCPGYIQIAAEQEEVWGADAAAFVADEEDDMVSVRTSGQLVLDELLRQADGAAAMLSSAVSRRLQDAAQAKVRFPAVPCGCSSTLQPSAGGCAGPGTLH